MIESDIITGIADRFATALDEDDFDRARSLLSADCVYHLGTRSCHGPDQIMASYREHSAWAKTNIESVTYQHQLEPMHNSTVPVVFMDTLKHQHLEHMYRCRQLLTIDPARGIVRIVHEEFPGERDKAMAFLEQAGVSYPFASS